MSCVQRANMTGTLPKVKRSLDARIFERPSDENRDHSSSFQRGDPSHAVARYQEIVLLVLEKKRMNRRRIGHLSAM